MRCDLILIAMQAKAVLYRNKSKDAALFGKGGFAGFFAFSVWIFG